jgi:hypothetical protein
MFKGQRHSSGQRGPGVSCRKEHENVSVPTRAAPSPVEQRSRSSGLTVTSHRTKLLSKGRFLILLVDRSSVADGPSSSGLRLGLALFPNSRPAFLLRSGNCCATGGGDAVALHSPLWLGGF